MKYKYRNIIIILLIILITINIIPSVLGKTRRSYLLDFIKENEIESIGFSNAIDDNNLDSYEATVYALEILDDYGSNPHEIETLQTNLENKIVDMFNNDQVQLYELFYLMKSLNILQYEIDVNLKNRISQYLNETKQIGGGFSFSNASSSVSLTSTYYVIQLYLLINVTIDSQSEHKNWIQSCNNIDGGYGGNRSLSSNLLNTYFAVLLFEELWNIADLVNASKTLSYLKHFYVNDSVDINNYGGYLPDNTTQYAMLSSSYLCVKTISLIDPNELNKASTISWILNHQNFNDGGFSENTVGEVEKISSIIASYYAFKTLKILNPSLSSLDKDVWMVEFNYWVLIIIITCIAVLIGIMAYIWRKRRI
ncbi:MAG: prenyltransferase/squalene oxidase repeat-containing protein [Promethearchaeota archaeon]